MNTHYFRWQCVVFFSLALMVSPGVSRSQTHNSPISYQGRLSDRNTPVQGVYEMSFALFAAEAGGVALAQLDQTVGVTNGLFQVLLDFDPAVFDGGSRWLEIAIRDTQSGQSVILAPRQSLAASPYALHARVAESLTRFAQVTNLVLSGLGLVHENTMWRNDGGQTWNMKATNDGNTIVRFRDLAGILPLTNTTAPIILVHTNGARQAFSDLPAAFNAMQNGDLLQITGRHTINLPDGAPAPLRIYCRTNMVVRGEGGAEIICEAKADLLYLANSEAIRIEGITFRGKQDHQIGGALFSTIILSDINMQITIENCRFIDFGDQAISHLWSPKLSHHVYISGCHFINGGAIFQPQLGGDGAAVSGIGSYWTIVNNYVTDCFRGFEIENSGTNTVECVVIANNQMERVIDCGVCLFATNGDGNKFTDINITGNTFRDFTNAVFSATAIRLAAGKRINVHHNIVHNMRTYGIAFNSNDGLLREVNITGNIVSEAGNEGIAVWNMRNPINNILIANNIVKGCGEGGISVRDAADVMISGNTCCNNGKWTVAAGIELAGPLTTMALVSGNKTFDSESVKSQDYGIWIKPGVSNAVVRDNSCLDGRALLMGLKNEGTNALIIGNIQKSPY